MTFHLNPLFMDASEVLEAQLQQLQALYNYWLKEADPSDLRDNMLKKLEGKIDLIHIRIKTNKIKLE